MLLALKETNETLLLVSSYSTRTETTSKPSNVSLLGYQKEVRRRPWERQSQEVRFILSRYQHLASTGASSNHRYEDWLSSLQIWKPRDYQGTLKIGIPCWYFCCQSFATWDVLLPSEELAVKLAGEQHHHKVLLASTGVQGYEENKSNHVQHPNVCLNREGFQSITHILTYNDQQMMVVVEGKRTHCWSCKILWHLARTCSQKDISQQ